MNTLYNGDLIQALVEKVANKLTQSGAGIPFAAAPAPAASPAVAAVDTANERIDDGEIQVHCKQYNHSIEDADSDLLMIISQRYSLPRPKYS